MFNYKLGDLEIQGGLKRNMNGEVSELNVPFLNSYSMIWEKRKEKSGTLKNKNVVKSNFDIFALPSFLYDYGTTINEPRYFQGNDGTIYEINIYSYSAIYYNSPEPEPWVIDTIRVHLYTAVQRYYRLDIDEPIVPGQFQEWNDDALRTRSSSVYLDIYYYGFIPRSSPPSAFPIIYDRWWALGTHYFKDTRFAIDKIENSNAIRWVPYQPSN